MTYVEKLPPLPEKHLMYPNPTQFVKALSIDVLRSYRDGIADLLDLSVGDHSSNIFFLCLLNAEIARRYDYFPMALPSSLPNPTPPEAETSLEKGKVDAEYNPTSRGTGEDTPRRQERRR